MQYKVILRNNEYLSDKQTQWNIEKDFSNHEWLPFRQPTKTAFCRKLRLLHLVCIDNEGFPIYHQWFEYVYLQNYYIKIYWYDENHTAWYGTAAIIGGIIPFKNADGPSFFNVIFNQ